MGPAVLHTTTSVSICLCVRENMCAVVADNDELVYGSE